MKKNFLCAFALTLLLGCNFGAKEDEKEEISQLQDELNDVLLTSINQSEIDFNAEVEPEIGCDSQLIHRMISSIEENGWSTGTGIVFNNDIYIYHDEHSANVVYHDSGQRLKMDTSAGCEVLLMEVLSDKLIEDKLIRENRSIRAEMLIEAALSEHNE